MPRSESDAEDDANISDDEIDFEDNLSLGGSEPEEDIPADDESDNDNNGDVEDIDNDEPNIIFGGKIKPAQKPTIKKPTASKTDVPLISVDNSSLLDDDDVVEGVDDIEDINDADDELDDNIVVLPKKLSVDTEFADQEYIERQIIVRPEDRYCANRLSEYEQTELISIRGTQIENYNNPMVDCKGLTDPIEMAKKELREKMSPLMLRRFVGEALRDKIWCKFYEDWNPNEMEHPFK